MTVLILLFLASLAHAGPLDTLQPGFWLEFPNSRMDTITPPRKQGGTCCTCEGYIGPAAIMSAWSSGAYDTQRDRLLVWGGGHGDYSGNELYAFSVDLGTWTRLTEPSTDVCGSEQSGYYPDGQPRSRHTYGYIEYAANIDKLCSFGSVGGFPGVLTVPNLDCFDFTTSTWARRNDAAVLGTGAVSAYDSSTGKVWVHGNTTGSWARLAEYNPLNDTWIVRTDYDNAFPYTTTAAIDFKRKKMVAVGGNVLIMWDIGASGKLTRINLKTTGDTSLISAPNPGFAYDPVSDKFVGWMGGTDLYLLDMDTLVWQKRSPDPGNTVVPPVQTERGTFGRFRYIPSKNAFIVVNQINQGVYAYKLSGGAPPPTISAPTDAVATPTQAPPPAALTLSWVDHSDNENGFRVSKTDNQGHDYSPIFLPANTTTYIDQQVVQGELFCYEVFAYNDFGVSEPTNKDCAVAQ